MDDQGLTVRHLVAQHHLYKYACAADKLFPGRIFNINDLGYQDAGIAGDKAAGLHNYL